MRLSLRFEIPKSLLVLALLLIAVSQTFAQGDLLGPENENETGAINLFVDIAENQQVEGMVVDIQKLDITTGFGDVKVPVDKIDGIKLNAMEDGSAVMAFKNGDVLTGTVQLAELKLKTSWGFATINMAYVEQITTVKGSTFSSSVIGGKRKWTFNRGATFNNN